MHFCWETSIPVEVQILRSSTILSQYSSSLKKNKYAYIIVSMNDF